MPGNKRWDAKRDRNEPEIVGALRAAGYLVYRDLPVDLLVRHPHWENSVFMALETKVPQKRGGIRKRRDQPKQEAIVKLCGIPRVTTAATALEAVRSVRHDRDDRIETIGFAQDGLL